MSSWSNALNAAMDLQGALGAALVDLETGACVANAEREDKDSLSLAALVNARMLRAQFRLVQEQKTEESIDDLLITFDRRYHLIRPIKSGPGVPSMFLYLIMDRSQANLAMTRRKLAELEQSVAETIEVDRRLEAIRHAERKQDTDASEMPAFMREDVVMRLLGLSSVEPKEEVGGSGRTRQ